MTKDDLIRMADLVGYDVDDDDDVHAPASGRYGLDPRLEHFAQLVAEHTLQYKCRNVSTKSQNVYTSAERVHEIDKSIHQHGFDRTASHMAGEYVDTAEQEFWDTSDLAHRAGGLTVEQEPVAWVRDLTSPQPHCVTSMKYLSIADTDSGVKYIPVYTAPLKREWVGLSDVEVAAYSDMFNGIRLVKGIEALLKRRNNG
jgi:hypothetical protein